MGEAGYCQSTLVLWPAERASMDGCPGTSRHGWPGAFVSMGGRRPVEGIKQKAKTLFGFSFQIARRCRAAGRARQHQYAAAIPKDPPRPLPGLRPPSPMQSTGEGNDGAFFLTPASNLRLPASRFIHTPRSCWPGRTCGWPSVPCPGFPACGGTTEKVFPAASVPDTVFPAPRSFFSAF